MKQSLLYSIIMGFGLTAVCRCGADAVVRAFIDSTHVFEYGVMFVRAILLSGPVFGILFLFMNALQAVGAAGESPLISPPSASYPSHRLKMSEVLIPPKAKLLLMT